MQLIKLCILSLVGLAAAAPSMNKRAATARGTSTTVKVVNNCKKTIQLGKLGTGIIGGLPTPMKAGKSISYTFEGPWSGRLWARDDCTGNGCNGANPNSLAEFTFFGGYDGQMDFYDVSFVDGYNLPISITPNHPVGTITPGDKYDCGAPSCKVLPACPKEMQVIENGVYSACKSACAMWGKPEYCCAGAFGTPQTCPINKYAAVVKKACPDVYSYAYDDQHSTFTCSAPGYTITFCPK